MDPGLRRDDRERWQYLYLFPHPCAGGSFARRSIVYRETLRLTLPWTPVPPPRLSRQVGDLQHLDLDLAVRRLQHRDVADFLAHQRPRDRRDPAHLVFLDLGLVGAHDADGARGPALVFIGHRGAEKDAVLVGLGRGVDDLGNLQPFEQAADAPVDLAQPFLAVDVIAVFRVVAIARRSGHGRHHFRPFDPAQLVQLGAHRLDTGRRDVVFGGNGHIV